MILSSFLFSLCLLWSLLFLLSATSSDRAGMPNKILLCCLKWCAIKSSWYLNIFSFDFLRLACNSWFSLLCEFLNPESIKFFFFFKFLNYYYFPFIYDYKHKENSIKSSRSSCSARTLWVPMVLLQPEHLSLNKLSSCPTKSIVQSEWRKHLFRKVYGLTSVWMSNIWTRMGRLYIHV